MKQIWNQAQTKYSLKFRLTPPAQSRRYTRCNRNRMRISQLNMKLQLQKCLIACKKGIDVVVRFQYSEIRLKSDLKTQSSSGSWIERVLLTPYQHRRMNFQWPLLLNPLKKNTLRALTMLMASPLALFLGQFLKIKKKNLSNFFSFFFSIFVCLFDFFLIFKNKIKGCCEE